jgi:hypothetical protein
MIEAVEPAPAKRGPYKKGEATLITFGLVAAAAIFYWLDWFNWAFWISAVAICSGVLDTIRAIINPSSYFASAHMAGAEPNYTMLLVIKAAVLLILILLAWYMGSLAGYF